MDSELKQAIISVFVFRPSDPTPIFSQVGVTDSTVMSAAFIPHSKKSTYDGTTLAWQNQSELMFINKKQELLSVSLMQNAVRPKTKEDVVSRNCTTLKHLDFWF